MTVNKEYPVLYFNWYCSVLSELCCAKIGTDVLTGTNAVTVEHELVIGYPAHAVEFGVSLACVLVARNNLEAALYQLLICSRCNRLKGVASSSKVETRTGTERRIDYASAPMSLESFSGQPKQTPF